MAKDPKLKNEKECAPNEGQKVFKLNVEIFAMMLLEMGFY